MTRVRCDISVSLDGFVAGPDPTPEEPLGRGGERLHDWVVATASWRTAHGREGGERNPDSEVADAAQQGVGAHIMGRQMFGGGEGPWDESWTGWWGDEPPFRVPVFVLTHHRRETVTKRGGTSFTFVTDGIDAALDQARAAAGDEDVAIAGGALTVQQYLAAGHLDELHLHVVPTLLGSGRRLLEDAGDPTLEPVEVVASPGVTHVKYRVVR